MPTSPADAFNHRSITSDDGVRVLTCPNAVIAALEAGYPLSSTDVEEASNSATVAGQLTESEFNELLNKNKSSHLTANTVALAILLVSPENEITRASLEQAFRRSTDQDNHLTEDEIDRLFDSIDTAHTSMMTCEEFMKALFGAAGLVALQEERYFLIRSGLDKLSYDEYKRKEKARLDEERLRLQREKEERDRLEREKAEREKQARMKDLKNEKKSSACC